jgi:FeS assembly SUF system regulator
MLRVTRQTDYGILLLTFLADRDDHSPVSSRELSEWSMLSMPMVAKILKPLAKAGVVESVRGAKGGYRLTREASDITVAEIIGVLEGPIGMTPCVAEPGTCEQEVLCPTKVNWERISHAVRDALEDIVLSEMVGRIPESLRPSGGDVASTAGTGLLSIQGN